MTRKAAQEDQPRDVIERVGPALVQHGPLSDRVYLMKLGAADEAQGVVERLDSLARRRGYSKFFAKVAEEARDLFLARGFVEEARVPRMHRGRRAVSFMSRFYEEWRETPKKPGLLDEVLRAAFARQGEGIGASSASHAFRRLSGDDAPAMAEIFSEVFASYPFPIHDPAYLRETMAENVVYHGAFENGRLVAVASAEMNEAGRNVEMTDFATLPGQQGKGLAGVLLARMEKDMAERGFLTAYTIARAASFGMNIAFARAGYRFAGRLIRNTNIAGSLECMNVWHKPLSGAGGMVAA